MTSVTRGRPAALIASRLGALVFLGAVVAAAPPSLTPMDEGPSNPAFFSFRAQLLHAVVARDVEALLAVVDPHIKNSFGGNDGMDEFFSRWPPSLDPFEHVAAIGSGIRIRSQPAAASETVGSVSFAILRLAPGAADARDGWTAVLLDGRTGYIASRLVRSPVAFRAFFSDASGQWRLAMFVAGD